MWWNDGTTTGRSSPWVGELVSHDSDTEQYKLIYDADGTIELINLATLGVQAETAENDAEMANRTMWMLTHHNGEH